MAQIASSTRTSKDPVPRPSSEELRKLRVCETWLGPKPSVLELEVDGFKTTWFNVEYPIVADIPMRDTRHCIVVW